MILQKISSVFVASESHQACAQMRHALWKSIFVCTFVRFPHLVCLVGLDKGKNLSRCLCPGSRPIFCLACNSPLTDSQAVASWEFVAKVSVLFMAGYYQPNWSQSFGSTFNSERSPSTARWSCVKAVRLLVCHAILHKESQMSRSSLTFILSPSQHYSSTFLCLTLP